MKQIEKNIIKMEHYKISKVLTISINCIKIIKTIK